MSNIVQSFGSPLLTLSDALALGMDAESAALAMRLQLKDVQRLLNPSVIHSLPACNAGVSDKSSTESSPLVCVVCLVENVCVRLECGHAVLCTDCAESLKNAGKGMTKCPVCRNIGSVVDSGPHLNLQPFFLEFPKLTTCDGCKVAASNFNLP
jgi:hypothetical protein